MSQFGKLNAVLKSERTEWVELVQKTRAAVLEDGRCLMEREHFVKVGGWDKFPGVVRTKLKITVLLEVSSVMGVWSILNFEKILALRSANNQTLDFYLIVETAETPSAFVPPASFQYCLFGLLSKVLDPQNAGFTRVAFLERSAFYRVPEGEPELRLVSQIQDRFEKQGGLRVLYYPGGIKTRDALQKLVRDRTESQYSRRAYVYPSVVSGIEEGLISRGMEMWAGMAEAEQVVNEDFAPGEAGGPASKQSLCTFRPSKKILVRYGGKQVEGLLSSFRSEDFTSFKVSSVQDRSAEVVYVVEVAQLLASQSHFE